MIAQIRGWCRDWWLEYRIGEARIQLQQAPTRLQREMAWRTMAELIKQRSPAQVQRMERKANLV